VTSPPRSASPRSASPRSACPRLVTRWDLDKTYLRSDFYNIGDLWRSLTERPDQKRAVPGAATLLRLLGAGTVRVHVLSGSPRQMKSAILKRFAMDGVRVDRLTLKPNASNLFRLRVRALKDQLGYKLSSLLEARSSENAEFGDAIPEVLLGDDSEADAFVYSLYADLCAGAVDLHLLEQVLSIGHTYPDVSTRTLALADSVTRHASQAPVRILVHLDRQSPPSRFSAFGPRVVPFHNYVQASLLFLEWSYLAASDVYALCQEMLELYRFDLDAMVRSYVDLEHRGHLSTQALDRLEAEASSAPAELHSFPSRIRAARTSTRPASPPPVPDLDYLALAREYRSGQGRR
jgi:hypothetical protein